MFPSGSELIVIVIAVLILFGGKGVSEIARTLGKSVREMRKTARDLQREIEMAPADRRDHDKDELQG